MNASREGGKGKMEVGGWKLDVRTRLTQEMSFRAAFARNLARDLPRFLVAKRFAAPRNDSG